MTAPDPRLGEIEARLNKAEPGPWFLDADGVSVYYVFHNGDTLDRDRLAESSGADAEFIAAAPADVAYLLDLARKQAAALEAATRLIGDLTDHDDCWFDHHGGCQAHGYLSLAPGDTCPQQNAKDWTGRIALEATP